MRTMFILRGTPASGKSTWVKENHLEQYTLSADAIRLLYQCPVLDGDGKLLISQNNDGEVWNLLQTLLEERMRRGEFVVVDATHYRNSMLIRYKKLINKYRYRAYVVDFTDVSLEELLKRNSERDEYKFVPEDAIRKMYALFQVEKKPTTYAKMITKEEAESMLKESLVFDYNSYNSVIIFGDIHGCYEPLKEWFDKHPFDENTSYIFTGDYIDRGIQNKEVLEFLIELSKNKNVLMLEGNHERWLRLYANDETSIKPIDTSDFRVLKKYDKGIIKHIKEDKVCSHEFITNTVPQIKDIDKKELRTFCDRFAQMAYVNYRGKVLFVCHGGITCKPSVFIPTYQLVNGVGKYEDTDILYKTWEGSDITMIHAHRNSLGHDVKVSDNIYNLCDSIEFGGNLRVLVFDNDGNDTTYKIKNNTYREYSHEDVESVDTDILTQLENSSLVIKKDFGDISSYNFSHKAFSKRIWNDVTCKARGLFVDNVTRKVVMRSYDKFFNMKEVDATKPSNLKKNLTFPVNCYRKENGFLAMVSCYKGELLFGSKSTIEGTFVEYIKEVFNTLPEDTRKGLRDYINDYNVTLVFECVNAKDNTHPIWYAKNHLYLLDIIHNDFEFKKDSYRFVKQFAKEFNLEYKQLVVTLNSWEEFWKFKKDHDSTSPNAKNPSYEGFVFEDYNGFMFKYKLPFYRYWKGTRRYLESKQHNRDMKFVFKEERDVAVYEILKNIENAEGLTIVDIEKMFYDKACIEFKPVDI